MSNAKYAWYKDLTRYQWFVLAVCCIGWMFDTMAQQIFNLARKPAIHDLMGARATDAMGAYATSIFMLGWATGGVVFGILGDRIGRVRTMVWTILCYTLFTGLSMLATGIWDFNAYRFPVRPGRRRAVLRGGGAGGRSGAGARTALRPGYAAIFRGHRQYDRRCSRDWARLPGTLGRHPWSVALGVSLRRGARAACVRRLPQAEGARAMAQGARRKEAAGILPRTALRPALGTQFAHRPDSGGGRSCRPVGHRLFQLRLVSARADAHLSPRRDSAARRWPARPLHGSASRRCFKTWADFSASTRSPI
jgi:hypothetical protein